VKIVILGGGPAGLYCGLLLKKSRPQLEITIIERNPATVTYGWGVVFSDRTLASFQRADYRSYEQIAARFVIWDAINVIYRGETLRCGGHVIASIARTDLLHILQERCRELGIALIFEREVGDPAQLPAADLLIAADGINSVVRRRYAEHFRPTIRQGRSPYIWLGTRRVLDAFTFIFRENEHGLFQVHAYPSSGTFSTFIVECDEQTWRRAGLDQADEATSLAYCQRLFAEELRGAPLLSNNSRWISFATLTTERWHYRNIVLLGDAAHTAHFSIGSGTKLAMEDAIALAAALEQYDDLEEALTAYELERRPVVETFQRAAAESQRYFENTRRYLDLEPLPFAFQLLTRSGRISYDDLRLRDAHFIAHVDRHFAQQGQNHRQATRLIAPPPLFTPLRLRTLTLPNRAVLRLPRGAGARAAAIDAGAGLLLTDVLAVSPEGRITPQDEGLYEDGQIAAWATFIEQLRRRAETKIGVQLGHAGRRGATQARQCGLDRPLPPATSWPLLAPSPLPYTPFSQTPRAMTRSDMEQVRAAFVAAAGRAQRAGFDLLHVHCAHGYLLASFLSPLSNQREDEYGGDLAGRLRFPLEVIQAVRVTWPAEKPLAVTLNLSDCRKDGFSLEEAISVARALKACGVDLIAVEVGQTTPEGIPAYGRAFLTAFSERLRHEAAVTTLVGGYLTTADEVNTILAAGRADLCLLDRAALQSEVQAPSRAFLDERESDDYADTPFAIFSREERTGIR
jgi:anthraniloyl-CoA monooxygenase